jgi:hypothetical protein
MYLNIYHYEIKCTFLPIKNGDRWGVIMRNTYSLPGVEITSRDSSKLVLKWQMYVSMKFTIIHTEL